MDIILNYTCNNHCSYCFQKEYKDKKEEFTLENLEKLLQWANFSPYRTINILGGEPTLYKELPAALEMISSYYEHNKPCLITNLLGYENNFQYICHYNSQNELFDMLINTTIDTDKKQLFERRLEKISRYNNPDIVTLGITLVQNEQINEYNINYITYLFDKFQDFHFLRIGPQMPGNQQQYLRYNFSNDILKLLKNLPKNIMPFFDCSCNCCMLDGDVIQYMRENFYEFKPPVRFGCIIPPVELLPDFSAKYCFASSNKYKVNNIFDFPNYNILEKYFKSLEFSELNYSKECQNCEIFTRGACCPCHAVNELWNIEEK